MSLRDAVEAFRGFVRKVEPRHIYVRAIAGDGAGNVAVSGHTNLYWARVLGEADFTAQAFCDTMIPAHGQHVILEEKVQDNRKRYVIVGRPDDQGWFDEEPGYGLGSRAPEHHVAHELGGPDMINVAKYLHDFLRATATDPGSMQIYVSGDNAILVDNAVLEFTGTNSPTFTAPTWGQRYDALVLNSDGDLEIIQGTEDWISASYPTIPDNVLPVCYVLLQSGDTYIPNARIYDCRPFFTLNSGSAGEGTHVHIFHEDHSAECDGAKILFHPANQFEFETLQIFYNGLHLTLNEDFVEGAFYDEVLLTPASALLPAAPIPGDKLIFAYLAELGV